MTHQARFNFRLVAAMGLAALTLMFLPLTARADDQPPLPAPAKTANATQSGTGWYLGGSLGGVFPGGLSNQSLTVAPPGITASATQGFNLQAGFSGAAQAGYQFDWGRAEGEFLYQSLGRNATTFNLTPTGSATTSFQAGGSSIDTYSLFMNGYYDFQGKSQWSPYVGAGLGCTWLTAGTQSAGNGVMRTPGLNQSAFAYQAKLGVSYHMSTSTAMFFQYRYSGTAGFKYGGATVTAGGQTFSIPPATGGLSNHALELGVRIRP